VQGSDAEKEKAFRDTYVTLDRRIGLFTSLPIAGLDQLSLSRKVARIGTS